MLLRPPTSTLFPYTTLFRSVYATWDRFITPGGSIHASDQGIINSRSYKQQTFFSKSTDAGATWSEPQQIFVTSSFSGSIGGMRSEEHTSELQSLTNLVCRLL